MPLGTTVIGSWPKPPYLKLPDWFRPPSDRDEKSGMGGGYETTELDEFLKTSGTDVQLHINRAVQEVITTQTDIGIDVVTDGEMCRENYIYHFCRQLEGFTFQELTEISLRNGAYKSRVPTVVNEVKPRPKEPWCWKEWESAQKVSGRPVKYTLPGPLTIMDSTANHFYPDKKAWGLDLVKATNREIRGLVDHGCKNIQIDEPLMMRNPELALDFGIDYLTRCLEGIGPEVFKTVHLCCGYPDYLDTDAYPKADKTNYLRLAKKLDNCGIDAVSIEDAEAKNDLSLLKSFTNISVVLGSVRVARTRVESVEEIKSRVSEALQYIPKERLILAPDCGLGMLPLELVTAKLTNMVAAAKSF